MDLCRRSFLAAVMGAIASPLVQSFIPSRTMSPDVWTFGNWADYDFCHYTVWDSVVVRPGEVLAERLLPPPVPEDFQITSIGSYFDGEAAYKVVGDVSRAVRLTLRDGRSDLLAAPLYVLPAFGAACKLVVPYMSRKGNDLGIYLDSYDKPVESVAPVTVSIILQGLVRRVPVRA